MEVVNIDGNKRVSRKDCIVINNKLYAPGTVVKVSEKWVRNHYHPERNEYSVNLFVKTDYVKFDVQPYEYVTDHNGNMKAKTDFGDVFVKSLYWEYVGNNEDRYLFQPVVYPYITRRECYFNPSTNGLIPFSSDCVCNKIREKMLSFCEKHLIPDYVDIEYILSKKRPFYQVMNYMIRAPYLQDAIVDVVDPIEWNIKDNPNLPDDQIGSVMLGWFVYILLMLASIIFNDRWFLWIMFTVFWVFIRQMLVNQASGY